MRGAGVQADFVLVRTLLLSQAGQAVQYADISLNTELDVLRRLSGLAAEGNKIHKVVLMIEPGDLREGIPPENLPETVGTVLGLAGIETAGIGTNLGCFGGIVPDRARMDTLSDPARSIERRFGISMEIVSGRGVSPANGLNPARPDP